MTYECRDAALKSACPDPSVDGLCDALTKSCAKNSVAECRQYFSGLNAAGRAAAEACAKKCAYGIYSCVEGL